MVHWYAVPPSHSERPGFDYRPSTIVYILENFFFSLLCIYSHSLLSLLLFLLSCSSILFHSLLLFLNPSPFFLFHFSPFSSLPFSSLLLLSHPLSIILSLLLFLPCSPVPSHSLLPFLNPPPPPSFILFHFYLSFSYFLPFCSSFIALSLSVPLFSPSIPFPPFPVSPFYSHSYSILQALVLPFLFLPCPLPPSPTSPIYSPVFLPLASPCSPLSSSSPFLLLPSPFISSPVFLFCSPCSPLSSSFPFPSHHYSLSSSPFLSYYPFTRLAARLPFLLSPSFTPLLMIVCSLLGPCSNTKSIIWDYFSSFPPKNE